MSKFVSYLKRYWLIHPTKSDPGKVGFNPWPLPDLVSVWLFCSMADTWKLSWGCCPNLPFFSAPKFSVIFMGFPSWCFFPDGMLRRILLHILFCLEEFQIKGQTKIQSAQHHCSISEWLAAFYMICTGFYLSSCFYPTPFPSNYYFDKVMFSPHGENVIIIPDASHGGGGSSESK